MGNIFDPIIPKADPSFRESYFTSRAKAPLLTATEIVHELAMDFHLDRLAEKIKSDLGGEITIERKDLRHICAWLRMSIDSVILELDTEIEYPPVTVPFGGARGGEELPVAWENHDPDSQIIIPDYEELAKRFYQTLHKAKEAGQGPILLDMEGTLLAICAYLIKSDEKFFSDPLSAKKCSFKEVIGIPDLERVLPEGVEEFVFQKLRISPSPAFPKSEGTVEERAMNSNTFFDRATRDRITGRIEVERAVALHYITANYSEEVGSRSPQELFELATEGANEMRTRRLKQLETLLSISAGQYMISRQRDMVAQAEYLVAALANNKGWLTK